MNAAKVYSTLASMQLPSAVLDAQAIYENAWRDFLRRGFHLENATSPIAPYGVTDASIRMVVRRAAGQRRIMFVLAYAPMEGGKFSADGLNGQVGENCLGHWILDVPRQKRAQALIAMLNLVVPSNAPGWQVHASNARHYSNHRESQSAGAPLRLWRRSMSSVDPRCEPVWTAITRALATNNDIRAQMGLPLFTGGVTEQEAA